MIAYWRRMERLCLKYWCKDGTLTVEQADEVENGGGFPASEKIRCSNNISLWYRIERLLPKIGDPLPVADLIVRGDEDGLRKYYRTVNKTREQLIEEARNLNVPYYGRLTKKELKRAIEHYQKNQVVRQKFERKAKRPSTL